MSTFRCSYCAIDKADDERSREHPLSQALGGSGWATRDVCSSCNAYAGQEIDERFAREISILWDRHRHGIPNTRGDVPKAPRIMSRLKTTGEQVHTVMDRGGWYAQLLPVETWQDESRLSYGVGAQDRQEAVKKKLERLRKKYGPQVFVEAMTNRIVEPAQVEVSWTHNATLWPRFGAKLGLGFGREVLGEGWLGSDVAQYLRDVFFGRPSTVPASHAPLPSASEPLFDSPLASYFVTPDHVVTVMGTDHGAVLGLFFFGDQRYLVPLGGEVTDNDPATWIFNPRAGSARLLTWNEYAEYVKQLGTVGRSADQDDELDQ